MHWQLWLLRVNQDVYESVGEETDRYQLWATPFPHRLQAKKNRPVIQSYMTHSDHGSEAELQPQTTEAENTATWTIR